MDTPVDQLLVEVRASTTGFAADIAQLRSTFDGTLVDGFDKAGSVLERSLIAALRKGSIGFEDLGRAASRVLDQIAASALKLGLDTLLGGSAGGGGGGALGGLLGGLVGTLLGLPGRATGGPVSPGRAFVVGERGPELFVPTAAGRVEATGTAIAAPREVRVAISVVQPRGASAPVALQRSSRQVAAAVRRSLAQG